MESSKSLELHLTEAELETLINAVRSTSGRLLSLNLGCAQLGDVGFLNLTTARSLLTLAERVAGINFYGARSRSMPTPAVPHRAELENDDGAWPTKQ
jgi:hypothetical protein